MWINMQEVEWCAGELNEEEYKQSPYRGTELRPTQGRRIVRPRYDGTRYECRYPE